MYFQKIQRKKGIVWKVCIDYTDIYGRKHTYTKGGFKTKKQAQEHGAKIEIELKQNGDIANKNPTLNEVYEDFMKIVGSRKYAPSTVCNYESAYNHYVKKSIGQCKIKDLHFKQLQEYFNSLDKFGKGTNNNIKCILRATFIFAIQNGYIKDNPVQYVEIGGQENHYSRVETITYDQLQSMVKMLITPRKGAYSIFKFESYAIAMYISYYLGLRVSETLALNKSDFDFENDSVYIDKRLEYTSRKRSKYYVTNKMKSKSSKAKLPVPQPLKYILIDWFKKNPYELVCTDENGFFLNPNCLSKVIKKCGEEIGINFSFHILKHSYATNCVKSKIPLEVVQKLCRHSNIKTTLNTYTHTNETELRDSINTVFNTDFQKNPTQNLLKEENQTLN